MFLYKTEGAMNISKENISLKKVQGLSNLRLQFCTLSQRMLLWHTHHSKEMEFAVILVSHDEQFCQIWKWTWTYFCRCQLLNEELVILNNPYLQKLICDNTWKLNSVVSLKSDKSGTFAYCKNPDCKFSKVHSPLIFARDNQVDLKC